MIDPLPDLRAADLGRGCVFHQIVERHRATAAEPGFDVLHADAAAFAHAAFGALALVRLDQFLLADIHVLALAGELVRAFELAEDFHRDLHEIGMGDPGAVMAVLGFAFLVGADLVEGGLVGGFVALHGDLRRHAAHREGAALMAGLHEKERIGVEEGVAHHDLRAVRQDEVRVFAEPLDVAEDVVPTAAIEADDVVLQLVKDFVHLEGGGQRLDQDRRLDGAVLHAERLLGVDEDVVPEPRFLVALHLRQIEIGAGAGCDLLLRIVEEVEAEIENAAGHRLAVDLDMGFLEMPAARTDDQRRGLLDDVIGLAVRFVGEADRLVPIGHHVDLAADHVVPGRRGRVLEVRHVGLRAGIERVDDHLAVVDGARDFGTAVEQVLRDRRDLPVALADILSFGQEVGELARVEALLALGARGEQLAAAGAELALEPGNECEGFRRQDTLVARLHRALDGNAVRNRRGCCLAHARSPPWSIFSMSVCARSYSLDTCLSNIS